MSTYREIFRRSEFRSLWLSSALSNASSTMTSLTLAIVVNNQTGSALLTAFVMFGPSLAQVVGASTLMSAADTAARGGSWSCSPCSRRQPSRPRRRSSSRRPPG